MNFIVQKFWDWYKRSYKWQLRIAAVVFSLQLIHLFWLTVNVVLPRAFGLEPLLGHHKVFEALLALVDFLEVPTIVSVSLLYIDSYRKKRNFKDLLYLFFLNTQWLHIFWITDEFVVDVFTGGSKVVFHPILAWVAILIDYLELPVIYDTLKRVFREGLVALEEKDQV